jgi:hypothetical protein
MNIFLWVLQVLLALHTIAGAIWKFSNSAQTIQSLNIIPHGAWLTLSIIELFCTLDLILPAFNKNLGKLAPIAAALIAAEMLLFCGLDIFSGNTNYGHLIYWFVVAIICSFIVYGRFVLKPIQQR